MTHDSKPHVEVRVDIEQVPHRRAAWRELWRQIFEAVTEEFERLDGQGAGNTEESTMGPVEHAIRAAFRAPTVLRTIGQGKEFVLSEIDDDGIVLLLGAKQAHTRLPWECLESIPSFLNGHSGWVPAGGARRTRGEPGTLDEHLKHYIKRDVARWVTSVLFEAGVIDIGKDRPLRLRTIESLTR